MQVLLKDDVKKLGTKGSIVEVSEGYARNFLIPKGLAEVATAVTINQAKQEAALKAHRAAQRKDEAIVAAAQLKKVTVTMKVKLGQNGKMFGALAAKDVAEALIAQTGCELIDRRKVELSGPIKGPGTYQATAKLCADVSADFTVVVEAE